VRRAVVFDLFNTLLSGANEERDVVVAEMAGILGVDPVALVRAYHESWPDRLTRWGAEETARILAERIGGSPSGDAVARATELRRDMAARILAAVPATTVATLTALRAAGWRLGLVSNATADSAEAWPRSVLAGIFDVAVFSADAGVAKPDRAIYLGATRGLGVEPGECVYVGDGAEDELAGAAALGMAAIRTTEFADNDPAWTGPTIAALTELPSRLRH
jgi:putative hydrolase of the HAD superfamily